MLAIEAFHSKTTYTTSAASAAHEPLPLPVVSIIIEQSSDALTNWLNERWKKTDFQVSREVVCFTLRTHGRDARMGLGDHLGGALYRGTALE